MISSVKTRTGDFSLASHTRYNYSNNCGQGNRRDASCNFVFVLESLCYLPTTLPIFYAFSSGFEWLLPSHRPIWIPDHLSINAEMQYHKSILLTEDTHSTAQSLTISSSTITDFSRLGLSQTSDGHVRCVAAFTVSVSLSYWCSSFIFWCNVVVM